MRFYTENKPKKWIASLILVICFICTFPIWRIASEELTSNEGQFATAVSELTHIQSFVTLHHRPSKDVMPLYPLIVKVILKSGVSIEFALRIVPILSLALLSLFTGVLCFRACGRLSGIVATLVSFSSYLAVYHAIDGYPHVTTAFLLYSGWILWFHYGQTQNRWNIAWISAGIFSVLIFFFMGAFELFLFLLPLATLQTVFLQTAKKNIDDFQDEEISPPAPHQKWHPLRAKAFFPILILLILALLYWFIPLQNASQRIHVELHAPITFISILTHFFLFPFDFFIELLPWSLVLWLPFCPLFFSVEPDTPLMKAHRTLLLTLIAILWITPVSETRDIIYVIPLIAFLIGADYLLIIRRYSKYFFFLSALLSILAILINFMLLLAILLPEKTYSFYSPIIRFLWHFIPDISKYLASHSISTPIIFIILSSAVAISAFIMTYIKYRPWIVLSAILIAFSLSYWDIIIPLKAEARPKYTLANDIRLAIENNLPPDSDYSATVSLYKDSAIGGLYAECFYTNLPVFITAPDSLPDSFAQSAPVFMLTTGIPSSYQGKSWTLLLSREYRGNNLYLYKGSPTSQTGVTADDSSNKI